MNARWLVLVLLLVPFVLLGANAWRKQAGTQPLLAAFAVSDVARIEIARGRDQVVLGRRIDTGQWEILSAADAPGDADRITTALRQLQGLRGRPLVAGAAGQVREPLEARLLDARGDVLAHAAFWTDAAERRPDGPRLAIERAPALPLWPSAWSALQAPVIPVAEIVQVERLTPDGPVALDPEASLQVAAMLRDLAPKDFVAGAAVNWMGARQLRVRLKDGSAIDLQQVPDGEGRFHLRLASDTRSDIRSVRRFAFRTTTQLP